MQQIDIHVTGDGAGYVAPFKQIITNQDIFKGLMSLTL